MKKKDIFRLVYEAKNYLDKAIQLCKTGEANLTIDLARFRLELIVTDTQEKKKKENKKNVPKK